MRWVGLVALAGCRQIFGIGDPGAAAGDAPPIPIDTPRADARTDGGPPPSQLCDSIDGSLVGCWDFDGNLKGGGPYHLDITATGVPTYVAGHIGQAVDATNVDLNVAESPLLDVTAVTIEAWIYADSLPSGGATRASILDNNNQYALYLEPNGTLRCYAGPATANMGNVIVAHTWMHVACTAAGAQILAYVDGVQVASGVMTSIPTDGSTGLTLGSDNPSGSGSRFSGKLDAVRLYSRALSATEVCRAFNPNC
ncbi:MAG TPA: LamG domain-containing protein [Kofleriaceae bacterium]|nr:LamG domain-containing protein [Kofleriaceae bacterium]